MIKPNRKTRSDCTVLVSYCSSGWGVASGTAIPSHPYSRINFQALASPLPAEFPSPIAPNILPLSLDCSGLDLLTPPYTCGRFVRLYTQLYSLRSLRIGCTLFSDRTLRCAVFRETRVLTLYSVGVRSAGGEFLSIQMIDYSRVRLSYLRM